MIREEICPECNKKVKILSSHMRMKHGMTIEGNPLPDDKLPEHLRFDDSGANSTVVEDVFEPSPVPEPTILLTPEQVQQMIDNAIANAVAQVSSVLTTGIEQVIDKKIEARVQAEAARIEAQIPHYVQPQPTPQGQPGGPSLTDQLAPIIIRALAGGENQNPQQAAMDVLVKLIGSLGDVVGAVDKMRGGYQAQNMAPNAALGWAKWGHQLAKDGSPLPEYPLQGVHVPPSPQTGPPPNV